MYREINSENSGPADGMEVQAAGSRGPTEGS